MILPRSVHTTQFKGYILLYTEGETSRNYIFMIFLKNLIFITLQEFRIMSCLGIRQFGNFPSKCRVLLCAVLLFGEDASKTTR